MSLWVQKVSSELVFRGKGVVRISFIGAGGCQNSSLWIQGVALELIFIGVRWRLSELVFMGTGRSPELIFFGMEVHQNSSLRVKGVIEIVIVDAGGSSRLIFEGKRIKPGLVHVIFPAAAGLGV